MSLTSDSQEECNQATIVAWARDRKSTLVNHWLRLMAADHHYRSAQLVFGWSNCILRLHIVKHIGTHV
jgi:hypothetical protein